MEEWRSGGVEEEVKCVWRATLEGEGKTEWLECLCEESTHLESLSAAWRGD